MTKTGSVTHSKEAAIKEVSNSKINKQGVIKGSTGTTSVPVIKGHHTLATGLNHTTPGPIKECKPAQGLISLFRKTGTERCNPKLTLHVTRPPNKSVAPSQSYVEVLHSGMDSGGKYGSGTGNGVRGSGASSFRGQGQGEAYARAGCTPLRWLTTRHHVGVWQKAPTSDTAQGGQGKLAWAWQCAWRNCIACFGC
jgi:hypothetical protein